MRALRYTIPLCRVHSSRMCPIPFCFPTLSAFSVYTFPNLFSNSVKFYRIGKQRRVQKTERNCDQTSFDPDAVHQVCSLRNTETTVISQANHVRIQRRLFQQQRESINWKTTSNLFYRTESQQNGSVHRTDLNASTERN